MHTISPEKLVAGRIKSWFSEMGKIQLGDSEYEKSRVEVHRLPHLKVEMWGTQF
jgi:hypothetical protein